MQLLYAPPSPFARKVRAASIELGLESRIELVFIEVAPGKANEDYASSRNPLRKIPALVTDEGTTLFDSTVICDFLNELVPTPALVPAKGPERWRVLTNHALAQGMCEAAVLIRYETWLRPEASRWPVWIDDQWDKVRSGLDWFDRHPNELEGPIDLAQITLGAALGYLDFRWPEEGWRDRHPTLANWFAELEQRPAFATTKPTPPPG